MEVDVGHELLAWNNDIIFTIVILFLKNSGEKDPASMMATTDVLTEMWFQHSLIFSPLHPHVRSMGSSKADGADRALIV